MEKRRAFDQEYRHLGFFEQEYGKEYGRKLWEEAGGVDRVSVDKKGSLPDHRVEKRMAPDGEYYTENDFTRFFGNALLWRACERPFAKLAPEKRLAGDGKYHDFSAFRAFYSSADVAKSAWDATELYLEGLAQLDKKMRLEKRLGYDGEYHSYLDLERFFGADEKAAVELWEEMADRASILTAIDRAASPGRRSEDGQHVFETYENFEIYHCSRNAFVADFYEQWRRAKIDDHNDSAPVGGSSAVGAKARSVETRMGMDGEYHTFHQFEVRYGRGSPAGQSWERAADTDGVILDGLSRDSENAKLRMQGKQFVERRMGRNGQYYSFQEFVRQGGKMYALESWRDAFSFGGSSFRPAGVERRMAMNGEYLDYIEFLTRFGQARGPTYWERARDRRGAVGSALQRRAANGKYYTFAEFSAFYGGNAEKAETAWQDAAPEKLAGFFGSAEEAGKQERRQGMDGKYLTHEEFVGIYGDSKRAESEWFQAQLGFNRTPPAGASTATSSGLTGGGPGSSHARRYEERRLDLNGDYRTWEEFLDVYRNSERAARTAWEAAVRTHARAGGLPGSPGPMLGIRKSGSDPLGARKRGFGMEIDLTIAPKEDGEEQDPLPVPQTSTSGSSQSSAFLPKEEQRMAANGYYYYSYPDLELFYQSKPKARSFWEQAAQLENVTAAAGSLERRMGMDAQYLLFTEFLQRYPDRRSAEDAWDAAAFSEVGGLVHLSRGVEKRMGADGSYYGYEEFEEYLGPAKHEWKAAHGRARDASPASLVRDAAALPAEQRMSFDGYFHTFLDFERFYGGTKLAEEKWEQAHRQFHFAQGADGGEKGG